MRVTPAFSPDKYINTTIGLLSLACISKFSLEIHWVFFNAVKPWIPRGLPNVAHRPPNDAVAFESRTK